MSTKTATSTQNKDDAKKFANLIGPMDPKLDKIVREKLVTACARLILWLEQQVLRFQAPLSWETSWSTETHGPSQHVFLLKHLNPSVHDRARARGLRWPVVDQRSD